MSWPELVCYFILVVGVFGLASLMWPDAERFFFPKSETFIKEKGKWVKQ